MKRIWVTGLLLAVLCGPVFAEDVYLPGKDKFQVCENKSGSGFYWVDSTSGDVWLVDVSKKGWIYCGKPEEAAAAEIGTYLPYPNKNGRGLFLLNASNGEGWYYDGRYWKVLGLPEKTQESE